MPQTLYDKIFESHLVHKQDDGTCLIYIDRHLVHEVTSPQAFEGLRMNNRKVFSPESTLAVADHNVPTTDRSKPIENIDSKLQYETLEKNCKDFGLNFFALNDINESVFDISTPRAYKSFSVVFISKRSGTFFNFNSSSDNKEAIRIGNAAFLAPEILTLPYNSL